jgi:hypothetical protein
MHMGGGAIRGRRGHEPPSKDFTKLGHKAAKAAIKHKYAKPTQSNLKMTVHVFYG